jgi:orotate phosphoribosyltransferase
VTTTGGSLLRTAKVVTDFGAHIKEIVTVVDREQGAKELFAREGYSFKSLLKVSELLI